MMRTISSEVRWTLLYREDASLQQPTVLICRIITLLLVFSYRTQADCYRGFHHGAHDTTYQPFTKVRVVCELESLEHSGRLRCDFAVRRRRR